MNTQIAPALTMTIGRKSYAVADHAAASALFTAIQTKALTATGRGPKGATLSDGCYITNNGKVWDGEWYSGKMPVYDPRDIVAVYTIA